MPTAGALIGALRITLGLDASQFEAGSKKARQTAKTQTAAIKAEFDKLKGLGSTIAGVWASSEIIAAGKRALDFASSLGEVAQQLGITTAELQEYRHVASQVGLSNEEMDAGLAKLTRTIGEAKAGSKAQATVFKELGLSVEDANGRIYSAGEMIPRIADALATIKDPASRARIEIDLFGKTGQKLDTMLAGGSAAVNNLRDAAHRLGIVLSEEQIQKADDTADKLSEIKQVLEAKIAGTVSDNANAIVSLANAFGYLTSKAGEAVQAYMRFKANAGIGMEESRLNGWLTSEADKKQARVRIKEYRDILTANGGEVRDPQYLRDKSLSDARKLFGYTPPAAKVGDGAVPTVATASPSRKTKGGGPSGPSEAEIAEKHFEELSRLRQEQMQAELRLTTDTQARADLESEMLLAEYAERSTQIANDKNFTVAQKTAQQAALKALYGVSGEGENIIVGAGKNSLAAGILNDLMEQLQRETYAMQTAQLDAERDALQGQLRMARTADERRKIELEILDLEYQLKAAKLDEIIKSGKRSPAEIALATFQQSKLGEMRAADTSDINRQNMGPMATYLDSLPKTADQINEKFEQIAANGLANMNDQLAAAAANTLKLKGLAGQLLNQMIADVIRLNLQAAAGGQGGLFGKILSSAGTCAGGGSRAIAI